VQGRLIPLLAAAGKDTRALRSRKPGPGGEKSQDVSAFGGRRKERREDSLLSSDARKENGRGRFFDHLVKVKKRHLFLGGKK